MAINTFVTTTFNPAIPGPIGATTPAAGSFTNLIATGNLDVYGTFTTTNTDTLDVADPMIYMARDNTGNTVDIGIVGHFVSGIYQHTGLVRDYTDGKWKLFSHVTTEPTTVIDFTGAVYDTLYLGTVEATTGMTIGGNTVATQNWVNSQGYLTSAAIGATVQAYSANLTSWAALTTSSKQDTLVSGTNIKTINGSSILGSGNLVIASGTGTVTSVAALTLGTTGTDLSSTVANSTTTPVITLNVPTASATNRGALSSTDWSTFNGKQAALVSGTNIKTINGSTVLGSGDLAVSSALAKSTSAFTTGTAATYTAPANTQWVKVTVIGQGGNGGASATGRATGGGGGAAAIKSLAMTAGQTLTYTVGTASGTASAVSSGTLVITTISAGSGTNGASTAYAASLTAGPAGGTATGGDVNITGGKGGYSYGSSTTITTNFSGAGGSSGLGYGQGGPAIAFVATAGVAGTGYGAGGGGAIGNATAASGTGGIIIFEAY